MFNCCSTGVLRFKVKDIFFEFDLEELNVKYIYEIYKELQSLDTSILKTGKIFDIRNINMTCVITKTYHVNDNGIKRKVFVI